MSFKYYEVSADVVAERLRVLLSGVPEVRIAVLFGSATRRKFVRDVDVCIYSSSGLELKDLIKIANLLEGSLGIPVDVVPLREAPPKLRLKALLEGIKLVVRDSKLYALMVTQALSEAMDIDLSFGNWD